MRKHETLDCTYIIDHDLYGERSEFFTLAEAQQAIRDRGPEFASTTLDIQGGNAIYNELGDCVGRIDY
jgi:hypothetical protein